MNKAHSTHEISGCKSGRFQEDIAFLSEMFPACDVDTLGNYSELFRDDPNYKSTIVNMLLDRGTSSLDGQNSVQEQCGDFQANVCLKRNTDNGGDHGVHRECGRDKKVAKTEMGKLNECDNSNSGNDNKVQSKNEIFGHNASQSFSFGSPSTAGRESSEFLKGDLNGSKKNTCSRPGTQLTGGATSSSSESEDDIVFVKSVSSPPKQLFCRTKHPDSGESSQRIHGGICIRHKDGALHPSMNKPRKLQIVEIDRGTNGGIFHKSPTKNGQPIGQPVSRKSASASERFTSTVSASSDEDDEDDDNLPKLHTIMGSLSEASDPVIIAGNQVCSSSCEDSPIPVALDDLEILKKVFPEADPDCISSLLDKFADKPNRVALVGKELASSAHPQSVKKKPVASVPWFWESEQGKFIPFNDAESNALEKEFSNQDAVHSGATNVNIKLPGSAKRYNISFAGMTMTCGKGNQTKIIRIPGGSEGHKEMSGKNLVPQDALAVPVGWQEQIDSIELINVRQGSAEWDHVQRSLKRSLREAQVTDIQRVQNKWLYRKYAIQRHLIKDKNGPTCINEKELFHGTRYTNPDVIWKGEDGFDMRHSADGMWGRGTYFASEASYCHQGFVHYDEQRNEFQLFLAHVLTGDSISLPPDRNIKMPPPKRGSSIRYDSVKGVTNGCTVYILYKLDMAYPAYLISYTTRN